MNSGHAIEDWIRSWDAGDTAALLAAMYVTYPSASAEACTSALDAKLDELSRRFWACCDEIYTRAYLYALAHAEDFAGGST
jgi:hypothetical protein